QSKGVLFWDDVQTPLILDFLNWSIFRAPWIMVPAFLIFYVAGLAETKRAPFDLPEAESELVSGFHTEFTGIRFSYFFLAEYCAMYVVCVLGAILFFGGWHWPLPTAFVTEDPKIAANIAERLKDFTYSDLAGWQGVLTGVKRTLLLLLWDGPWATIGALTEPASIKMMANELFGFINLVGKSFFLMFVMLWVRWTLPRVRLDQVMHMCLKVLLPIGLACVVLASVQAVLTSHDPSKELRAAAIEHSTGAPAAQTKSEEGRSKDEKNDEASAGKDAAGKPAKEKTEEGKTEEKK
ncbi:NADH-quinone oxidoreductase subunit H, partial [Candidatus Sumerlaeota bacterium]|nr:NADH-quinone oxidoreductase subunit H [Candidatus Sumerlaeota bacterium]